MNLQYRSQFIVLKSTVIIMIKAKTIRQSHV